MHNIEVTTKDGKMILHQEYQVFEYEQFDEGGYIFFQKNIIRNGGRISKSVKYPLAGIRGFTVELVDG